jgi:hypothetical protein
MKKNSSLKWGGAIALAMSFCVLLMAAEPKPTVSGVYSFQLLPSSTTNFVTPYYFDTSKSQNATWACQAFGGGTSGGTNTTYYFAPSLDGIGFDTNRTIAITGPVSTTASANTNYWGVTSTNVSAVQGYFLVSATCGANTSGSETTNYIKNGYKIASP